MQLKVNMHENILYILKKYYLNLKLLEMKYKNHPMEQLHHNTRHQLHTDLHQRLNPHKHHTHLQRQFLSMIQIEYHHLQPHKQHQHLQLLLLLYMFFLQCHQRTYYLHCRIPSLTMNQHNQQGLIHILYRLYLYMHLQLDSHHHR